MSAIDKSVNESNKRTADTKYGCWNRKAFASGYRAPNRYQTSDGYQAVFKTEARYIPFTMSRNCNYDMATKDSGCIGCVWINEGR